MEIVDVTDSEFDVDNDALKLAVIDDESVEDSLPLPEFVADDEGEGVSSDDDDALTE